MTQKYAVPILVADAIVAELSSDDFKSQLEGDGNTIVFTPERSYADWPDELEEMACPTVDVVPVDGLKVDADSRESVEHVVNIDIAVRRRFGVADESQCGRISRSEIDALALLVQSILEWFSRPQGRRLSTYENAFLESTEILNLYGRDSLRQTRMFFGVVRTTWRVSKATFA